MNLEKLNYLNKNSKILIFTDLDGTLLNHDDYSFQEAMPSIRKIQNLKNAKIIIVTSKTFSEVEQLVKKIGIDYPFITENGGGIFFPENRANNIQLGIEHKKISEFVAQNLKNLIIPFSEMSFELANNLTGLSSDELKLAQKRDFTEPFILKNNANFDEVQKIVNKSDLELQITEGGRFYHLISQHQDKGKAVEYLINYFNFDAENNNNFIFGLGDSKNDVPMLKIVEFPILIKKHNNNYQNLDFETIRSDFIGSKGWNETIYKYILNKIKDQK
jgi:mannosyl-3-phosphoglycerate phosphatase